MRVFTKRFFPLLLLLHHQTDLRLRVWDIPLKARQALQSASGATAQTHTQRSSKNCCGEKVRQEDDDGEMTMEKTKKSAICTALSCLRYLDGGAAVEKQKKEWRWWMWWRSIVNGGEYNRPTTPHQHPRNERQQQPQEELSAVVRARTRKIGGCCCWWWW